MVWLTRVLGLFILALLSSPIYSAVVLQYHHVSNDTPASTSIRPALFEQHLNYLEENDYQIWSSVTLIETLKTTKEIPDNVVVITFDDAFQSIYDNAFPLLRARNWPFTVFVSPSPIDNKRSPYMSWQALRTLKKNGATIANHSLSHQHLVRRKADESKSDWLDRIRQDVTLAQERLEEQLGPTPQLFAYPYGEFTSDVATLISELGYAGFGQQSGAMGRDIPLNAMPRYPMTNVYGAMKQFKTKVASLPMAAKQVFPADRIITSATLKDGLRIEFFDSYRSIQCFVSGHGSIPVRHSDKHLTIEKIPSLPSGRSRINCTAPSKEPGRFHWFSYFWMKPLENGQWYPEP